MLDASIRVGSDVHGGATGKRGDDSRDDRDASEPSPSLLFARRAKNLPRADGRHGAGGNLGRLVQLGLEARGERIEVLVSVLEHDVRIDAASLSPARRVVRPDVLR